MDDLLARLEPFVGCKPVSAFLVIEVRPGEYHRILLCTAHLGHLAKAVAQFAHECHNTASGTH